MTRQSYLILAGILFFVGMCCIAFALTVAPMGAHWVVWVLPAIAGLIDVLVAPVLIYTACKAPDVLRPRG